MHEDHRLQFFAAVNNFRKLREIFRRCSELSLAEFVTMKQITHLSCGGTEVHVSDIKEVMDVSKSAITQSLNTLENKGYIVRKIAEGDRRSFAIIITEKGRTALSDTKEQNDKMAEEFIKRFGEENMRELVYLTKRLSDVIDQMNTDTQKG